MVYCGQNSVDFRTCDIVKNHLIDPMHNFYLGTAKHVIKVWKEKGLIRQEHLNIIQSRIDELNVPYGVGRIPYKIGSNFSGLTADQWLNWTNIYSLYTLRDVVPTRDLDCWSLFVRASVLLRQYTISMKDIDGADEKLLEFCKIFEALYRKEYCNPNMHLHAHVKECVLDFGPISAFWAFPFERFNGILESFSKNWVKPEDQIVKKFQQLMAVPEFSDLATLCLPDDSNGSLHHTKCNPYSLRSYKKNALCDVTNINPIRTDIHEISSKVAERYFSEDDLQALKDM